jgi:hypothetical protein
MPQTKMKKSSRAVTSTEREPIVTETQDTLNSLRSIIATDLRLLTFRSTREELMRLNRGHLIFGLLCAWIVGVGRYWDNPRVHLLQHLGIGSVIYVFVLALFLWLLTWPLKPHGWSYFRVCTFIALVSPPAILYAVPVEKFLNLETANTVNAWFLFIVAAWRVALLVFFLRRFGLLEWFSVVLATLLPMALIMKHRSPNDTAYEILFLLSLFSMLIFPVLLVCYIVMAVAARQRSSFRDDSTLEPPESHTTK